jgi:hypothetical protein
MVIYNNKLLGGWPTPLKHDWVRQLGWWYIYIWKNRKKKFQTTSQLINSSWQGFIELYWLYMFHVCQYNSINVIPACNCCAPACCPRRRARNSLQLYTVCGCYQRWLPLLRALVGDAEMRSKMCSNVFDESMQHSLGIDLKNSDDRKTMGL